MRNKFAATFYEIAKVDARQCLIVADISPAGSIQQFREEFPTRFINTGVAEQIMVGMAAGLAMQGIRPWCYTIATFALYRPFEFVRDDLAYQGLPVTVVGIGGGVAYSTLGATHHAMEDVAIATAVPGLQVIAPSDPLEVIAATHWCAKQERGPVYLRLGKAGEPVLTEQAPDPWEFGKIRTIQRGSGICIVTYGTILQLVLQVAATMEAQFHERPAIYEVHTLSPLDMDGLTAILSKYRRVAVVEEMVSDRGLGVTIQAYAHAGGFATTVRRYGLQSQFKHVYGSQADLLAAHGLQVDKLAQSINQNGV